MDKSKIGGLSEVYSVGLYGWEEDAEKIWLSFFNRRLLSSGIITQDEYRKVEEAITRAVSLSSRKQSGIMNKS